MTTLLKHFASLIPSPCDWQHPHRYKILLPSLINSNRSPSIRTISCLQTSLLNSTTFTKSSKLRLNQLSGETIRTFASCRLLSIWAMYNLPNVKAEHPILTRQTFWLTKKTLFNLDNLVYSRRWKMWAS